MHDIAVPRASRIAEQVSRWAAVGLGATIPVSVALDGMLLAGVAAGWALSGRWNKKWRLLRANPVALIAIALFSLLSLGTLYGDQYPGDALLYLGKYSDLLFLVPFVWVFRGAKERQIALFALAASLALVLVLSWLLALGILPPGYPFVGNDTVPSVFKRYLTHNILLAFGAFLFAELGRTATTRMRWLWRALAILAVANVTYLMPGRTGHGILIVLLLYWAYALRGWRGTCVMMAALAVLAVILLVTPSSFRDRLTLSEEQLEQYETSANANTSTGKRLEYYRNSISIAAAHPFAGSGTGAFPKAYAQEVKGVPADLTRNPHNEYLLIMVQIGTPGLALLLLLFCAEWRLAEWLPTPLERHIARALVLTIAFGSLFNSLLLDHTEGLLHAWLIGLLFGGLKRDANQ